MRPLSRTFRRNLFWLLVGVFIVGTPILIGYSKGYRLDDALLIIETGGIYIHSDLANTRVYIDGEFAEENGAFLKNTLIQDLRTNRTYEIWVVRDGYRSWTKELPVYPNLVTEAQVLMLPEVFEWRTISASTTVAVVEATTTLVSVGSSTATTTQKMVDNPEFESMAELFASDKDQFAVEVATSTIVTVKGKQVSTTTTVIEMEFPAWFEDFASTTVLADEDMVRERDGVVAWLHEGDLYATWGKRNETQPFYFCTDVCTSMIVIDWAEPITRYEFYPSRNDVMVLGTERGVYAVELDTRSQRNIQPFIEEPNLDFRILSDGSLVVFDGVEFRETAW